MTTKLSLVSVVICAYTTERWERLRHAVDSVLTGSGEPVDLIVVIDHCDELLDSASQLYGADRRVRVIPNTETQGLSGARNTGVRAARGDVVAFLDDDAVAQPGWADDLGSHFSDMTVAGVGGYASPVWPETRPSWMPAEFDWVVGCSYNGQPKQLAPVRNPIGCNMSLRRSVFLQVGGFRSEVGRVGATPVGCEETELFIRIRAGDDSNQVLFDPDIRVDHHVSEDRTTLRYFVRRCYHEGLSKAVVTDLAGAADGLSSERSYVSRVLPMAVARELISLTPDGLARASAILLGLAATTVGFVRAKIVRLLSRSAP
ncbi:glycosyltransferase involved in cell wall biosynthesis [Mycolicibacterium sp. BK634]|uniref:glycosyltransferase family 2 protein n=1 Tax=Mycolicibacterium sp. BK634 TaxID=2587099 RepID=UPI0016127823|nr:glycosyltransferase family 2 protein [Mycolicibacterium sp. BK634]MBB3750251.1 glycosyltransferase involved in cell wall biosynthesis [Mycolicibacterium sp. BK634]